MHRGTITCGGWWAEGLRLPLTSRRVSGSPRTYGHSCRERGSWRPSLHHMRVLHEMTMGLPLNQLTRSYHSRYYLLTLAAAARSKCIFSGRKKRGLLFCMRSSRPGQICVFECAHLAYYEERCRLLRICSIVHLHSFPCTFPHYNSVPTNGRKMCGPLITSLSSLRPASNL